MSIEILIFIDSTLNFPPPFLYGTPSCNIKIGVATLVESVMSLKIFLMRTSPAPVKMPICGSAHMFILAENLLAGLGKFC